jgi:hypothetical protein
MDNNSSYTFRMLHVWGVHTMQALTIRPNWGARYLTGENLDVVGPGFQL